jgi:hypothetical protein
LATTNDYDSDGGEEILDQREYADEEVKAVKLFFSGIDEFQWRC